MSGQNEGQATGTPYQPRFLHVVIISPADVGRERKAARETLLEINEVLSRSGLQLIPHMWEKARRGFRPEGAQKRIDEDLDIPGADLVIGIFWSTPGTVGTEGQTGSEHEIRTAIEAHERTGGKPEIMLYFSSKGIKPSTNGERLDALRNFKEEMGRMSFYGEFGSTEGFREMLRSDVLKLVEEERRSPKVQA